MADAVGLPSIGVEISAKRCRKAHNLRIDLDLVSPYLRKLALDVVEERQQTASEVPVQAQAQVEASVQGQAGTTVIGSENTENVGKGGCEE
jgi:phage repressor protein C with HTH and peptisase S24 domain